MKHNVNGTKLVGGIATNNELFDINSPEALLRVIKRNLKILQDRPAKETDRLLFVVLGLNHLRDWIAPGYRPKGSPATAGEQFYESIFQLKAFKLLNSVSNHTKHLSPIDGKIKAEYGLKVDQWNDWDSVQSFDNGPPSGYRIDEWDLLDTIDEVVNFYETNWFKKERYEPNSDR